ncbi:MAG: hypothetical protein Q8P67_06265, partial [archaeon]|nr:hypothetical protein [archaeon]
RHASPSISQNAQSALVSSSLDSGTMRFTRSQSGTRQSVPSERAEVVTRANETLSRPSSSSSARAPTRASTRISSFSSTPSTFSGRASTRAATFSDNPPSSNRFAVAASNRSASALPASTRPSRLASTRPSSSPISSAAHTSAQAPDDFFQRRSARLQHIPPEIAVAAARPEIAVRTSASARARPGPMGCVCSGLNPDCLEPSWFFHLPELRGWKEVFGNMVDSTLREDTVKEHSDCISKALRYSEERTTALHRLAALIGRDTCSQRTHFLNALFDAVILLNPSRSWLTEEDGDGRRVVDIICNSFGDKRAQSANSFTYLTEFRQLLIATSRPPRSRSATRTVTLLSSPESESESESSDPESSEHPPSPPARPSRGNRRPVFTPAPAPENIWGEPRSSRSRSRVENPSPPRSSRSASATRQQRKQITIDHPDEVEVFPRANRFRPGSSSLPPASPPAVSEPRRSSRARKPVRVFGESPGSASDEDQGSVRDAKRVDRNWCQQISPPPKRHHRPRYAQR